MTVNRYVLVTPARNEEAFIEKTLQSVTAQTILPARWAIVDDNSTDRTAQIIRAYAEKHPFIHLIQSDPAAVRSFAAKAQAFTRGYAAVRDLEFDFIGNLDADLSFPADYYARLVAEFRRDPKLGVAGGVYLDKVGGRFRRGLYTEREPSGCTQLFRRQCFIDVGESYLPLPNGGEDAAANILARMKGWHTRAFPDLQPHHHRRVGTGGGAGLLRARIREGRHDYFLGTHPLFALAKSIRRLKEPPFVVGAVARTYGFFRPFFRSEPKQVPEEFIEFLRREQMGRLRRFVGLEKDAEAALRNYP
jgi:biofilm PGA synthesis N-glycosyltransferase PgaC